MPLLLGKRPPRIDKRTLKMARYTAALPPPPPICNYPNNVKLPWGMLGNDRYGDCAFAAIGHQEQVWTAKEGRQYNPTSAAIVKAYLAYTGGTDDGSVLLDVLNRWRKTGIPASTHKIKAFAAVKPVEAEIRQAIWLFGGVYTGLSLPDYAVTGDMLATPWVSTTGAPNAANGHCVAIVGYDATGYDCITWGQRKRIAPAFAHKYIDELYATLDPKWGGVPGFDLAALQRDLEAL